MAKAPPAKPDPAPAKGLAGRLGGLRDWAAASKLRAALVGGGLLTAVALTIGGWLYMAHLAAEPSGPNVAQTLAAFDQGNFEQAADMARALQALPDAEEEAAGVALFVLGAVRAQQAAEQWSDERKGLDHLVASKYLQRALEAGVPADREEQVRLLAGRSLLLGNRVAKAIEVMTDALEADPHASTEFHSLLAEAYSQLATPDLQRSLEHNKIVLETLDPTTDEYAAMALDRANKLGRLGQLDEARQLLQTVTQESVAKRLVLARLDLLTGQQKIATATFEGDPTKIDAARAVLAQLAASLSDIDLNSDDGHEAAVLRAQAFAAASNDRDALATLFEMRQIYNSGPLATLASLVEGDVLRSRDEIAKALIAYRRALTTIGEPRLFRSNALSLDDVSQRLIVAAKDFREREEYEAAIELIEDLAPVVGLTNQLELRAGTLEAWGNWLLVASTADGKRDSGLAHLGRERLREAGVSYQQLAERRFATPNYIDDLWSSCECLFRGQGYSKAIEILDSYLRYEPEKRNAQALLRLGQSQLALGDVHQGIAALEECMEIHPDDASTFQARLDCARGYRDLGDAAAAEKLLLTNLTGSLLSPRSPEWRDSLFELGHLLHDAGRYTEAIDRLEEAVERYPDHSQARLAIYMIADAYRQAAREPLTNLRAAQTENERETAQKEVTRLLDEAIARYEQVQRDIALSTDPDQLDKAMLRNCYMLRGDALFDLGRYDEAIKAYSNVSTLYQREPFILETLLQISHCQRRMNEPLKARLAIEQALQAIDRMPAEVDFRKTTNFSREEWRLLLTDMSKW